MRLTLVPTLDKTSMAMRRSRPVLRMATEINMAAPTRIIAGDEKPEMMSFNALAVPSILAGASGFGEKPSNKAVRAVIMVALTG